MRKLFLLSITWCLLSVIPVSGQLVNPTPDNQTHEINMRLDLFRKTHEAGVFMVVVGAAGILLSENLTNHKRDLRVVGWTFGAIGAVAVLYAPTRLDDSRTLYFFRRKGK